MKYKYIIILFLFITNTFAQQEFMQAPEKYGKIYFIYEQKSNYYVGEKGIYADTLLIKIDFPELKYEVVKNPNNENIICGFIAFSFFDQPDQINKIVSSIYHNTETASCFFDIKTQTTICNVVRYDKELFSKLFKVFKKVSRSFAYKFTIDYNKKTITTNYPSISYKDKLKFNQIIYYDKFSGHYTKKAERFILENIVYLNENLNPKIVFNELFSNNEFGIKKIETLFNTTELKSVTYE